MKEMGHTMARIGLEWARIEPQPGVIDRKALKLYRDILKEMRKNGIAPMVTLWHFSNPMWLVEQGGWDNPGVVDHFMRYVAAVVPELGDLVEIWLTVNEPNIYASLAYYMGTFPPGKKSLKAMFRVQRNLADAHLAAYSIIHDTHIMKDFSPAKVGVASHLRTFDPQRSWNPLDRLACYIFQKYFNDYFLDRICRETVTMEVFGINYYSGDLVSFPLTQSNRPELAKNKLGWDIYPEGLYRVCMKYWGKYRLPIYITENGTCDDNDELRPNFILDHVYALWLANQDGAHVAGYIHWSTLDNFELVDGLMSRFGLVHVDHNSKTRKRTIKPSGRMYGECVKAKGIKPALLKKFKIDWLPPFE